MTAEYTYGIDNMRRSKTVNDVTTNYLWDGGNIVAEADGNNAITNRYFRGIGLIASKTGDNIRYYQTDSHGDVSKWGTVDYSYDAFGNETTETTGTNPFRYNGEYHDEETGFIYLRNRYYDPSIGRFISEDPIRDGYNWYVYANSNPIRYIDPTGYITQEEIDLYKSGKLSYDVYCILVDLGNRWNEAETDLAKIEIHNLAEDFRKNNYYYQDLSKEANAQLASNGRRIRSIITESTYAVSGISVAGLTWYNLVKNDGEWDYKKSYEKVSWMPQEEYFMLYGKLISFADYGNINYGYTGTILGLSPETLYLGAGYVQSGELNYNLSEYYGDSEVDYNNVTRGIEWANSIGYSGKFRLPVEIFWD